MPNCSSLCLEMGPQRFHSPELESQRFHSPNFMLFFRYPRTCNYWRDSFLLTCLEWSGNVGTCVPNILTTLPENSATSGIVSTIDLSHKSHNAAVPYPTMHHLVTEISICLMNCWIGEIYMYLSVFIFWHSIHTVVVAWLYVMFSH